MATTGKVPRLGFKAAAMKFVTLFGYSPNPAPVVDTSGYRPIAMTGSLTGLSLTGYATFTLTGHIPQQAFTGVYQDG